VCVRSPPPPKIGNLQAVAQFLSNASKSVSGTLADLLSPARMVLFGTLLTTLNKPMFALSGYVVALYGTVGCLYWITAAKVRMGWASGPARPGANARFPHRTQDRQTWKTA
jgi:MFS family permease